MDSAQRRIFMGRGWGDEFAFKYETDDGYRFIKNSSDGYYYYATIGVNVDFIPTVNNVGIDIPPASAYKLERSTIILFEIITIGKHNYSGLNSM